jgi:hypothetical protein
MAMPAQSPTELHRLDPPYTELRTASMSDRASWRVGSILVANSPGLLASGWTAARTRDLRRELPHVPFAAPVPGTSGLVDPRLVERVLRLGFVLVPNGVEPLPTRIRTAVANRLALPRAVTWWLLDTCSVRDAWIVLSFGRLWERHPGWSVQDWAEALGQTPSSLRKLCQRRGLPTPVRWRTVSSLLPILLRLQQDETMSLEDCCMNAEHDPRSVRRACDSIFGHSPGQLRSWAGVEPLLNLWMSHGRTSAA